MFKAKSTTKEARKIIQNEIFAYYAPEGALQDHEGWTRTLEAMHADAEAYGKGNRNAYSDWAKGYGLVITGCNFAVWFEDQAEMLKQIYGEKVMEWDAMHACQIYANLIGREYEHLLKKYHIE